MFRRKVIFQSTLFGALAGLLVGPLSLLYPFVNLIIHPNVPDEATTIWVNDFFGMVLFAPLFCIVGAVCGLVFGLMYGYGLIYAERRYKIVGGMLLKRLNIGLHIVFGITVIILILYSLIFLTPDRESFALPIYFMWVVWTPLVTLIFLNQHLLNGLKRY